MIDLNKTVVFYQGIELDGTEDPEFLTGICDDIYYCGKRYGLINTEFEVFSDMICFSWQGTKCDLLRFFTYYSKNMIPSETAEERKAVQMKILNK